MGFDLCGATPDNEIGEYFHKNTLSWCLLWLFVGHFCGDILTKEDKIYGQCNNGHFINKKKAKAIGERLNKLIVEAVKAQKEHNKAESVPDEPCNLCNSTGIRNDEHFQGKCNKCSGKGTVRPWHADHLFRTNVKDFAEFCLASNGFEIW